MTRGARAILGTLVRDVLDFCYPGRCAACDDDAPGGAVVCPGCDAALGVLEQAAACDRCGKPLAEPGAPCPWCLGTGRRPYARVVRLGLFKPPLRDLVHRMKYHRRWTLGEYLADRLWLQDGARQLLADADCLLPVPLHPLRQMSRGYNQSEVIARVLAKRAGARVIRPAVRFRHTETQTHLHSRNQRLENLRGAFGLVRPGAVRGRHVVVVDDVMTTGATLESLGRVLRYGRPASLSALVVAVADPRGADFQVL